jgi:hypothetical protein
MGPTSAPHGAPAKTETWKCPGCGATNRAGAQWCGQCFAAPAPAPEERSAATSPEPPPPPETAAGARPSTPTSLEEALLLLAKKSVATPQAEARPRAAQAPPPPAPAGLTDRSATRGSGPAVPTEAPEADAGSFSVRAEGITWACKWCEARNPLAEQVCSVCGAGFGEIFKEEKLRVARDPGTVALMSLFLPGAGHAYMGLWGQAVARAVISLWALLVCFFSAVQGGRGLILAVVFGVIAFALWVIAAHDGYREASGTSTLALIKSNHFLYLVLGLLGLQISMVFFVALTAR